MQITLDAEDITEALKSYLTGMGVDLTNKEVTSSFNAGRGANTHSATLILTRIEPVVNTTVADVEKAVEEIKEVKQEEQVELDLSEDEPEDTALAFD